MPTSTVNGVALYWERAGRGPRLLYCQGSGSTLEDTRLLLGLLSRRFEVLAFDYRGLGRSARSARSTRDGTAEPAVPPYAMSDLAADAAGLLDLAGWPSCRLLGVSFGGMVAQELAVTHPDRVERLALLCTSAGGAGGSSYPLHTLAGLEPPERAALALRLVDERWDTGWLASHPGDRTLAETMADRRRAAEGPDAPDAAGRRAQLEARAGHDVWDRLGAIACPTFVAYGRYDGIAPPANSEAIAARIPGAELRGYAGGHPFLAQDPDAMPDLLGFLRQDRR